MNKDINRELNSFRGFTLIELLAVIVVLAIIILIAVNAVLPQMERARRSSFAIEANGAIEAAKGYFMNYELLGSTDQQGNVGLPSSANGYSCVTIKHLIEEGFSDLNPANYTGYVIVRKGSGNTENMYFYEVWIQKEGRMMVLGAGTNRANGTNLTNGSATQNASVDESDVDDFATGSGNNTWIANDEDTAVTCPGAASGEETSHGVNGSTSGTGG